MGAVALDTTTTVALAGIVGTLLAGVGGPLVAELLRRRRMREEQLLVRRIDAYARLLHAARELRANTDTWSAIPAADLSMSDPQEVDRLVAEVLLVGGPAVCQCTEGFNVAAMRFLLARDEAIMASRDPSSGEYDPHVPGAAQARLGLGELAREVSDKHDRLLEEIRREVNADRA